MSSFLARAGTRIARRSAQLRCVSSRRSFQSTATANAAAEGEGTEATQINLNFTTPTGSMYVNHEVDTVIIPGVVGTYGVTAGHTPNVSELKPGVVEIFHDKDDKEPEKFFVAGGFAFMHPNSTCDITAIDAAKIEDLDGDAAAAAAAEYKSKMDAAAPESMERSEAEIGYDTANAILEALGRNQA